MMYKERFISTFHDLVIEPILRDLTTRWMMRRSFTSNSNGTREIELVSHGHPNIVMIIKPRTTHSPVTFQIGTGPRHPMSDILSQLQRVIPVGRIFSDVLVISATTTHVYDVDSDGTLFYGINAPSSPSTRVRGSTPTHSGSIPENAFDMPAYRAPSIEKSHFRSSVKTGSRSLRSQNYTGSGSHRQLRNGILQTELENTASSHPKMVYVKGDPTRLLAPMESWKQLPGQLHPLTRQPLGHSDLRKVKTIGKIIKKKK